MNDPQPTPPDASIDVSICIPTFNQAEYLQAAIDSALAQAGCRVEVVISENHCTDGTAAVLARINDPRVRVVRPPEHLSMGSNWRFCVESSRGRAFVLLSSDDVLEPDFSRRLWGELAEDPSLSFAFCAARLIDQHDRPLGVERRSSGSYRHTARQELNRFIRGAGAVLCATLVRRSAYDTVGGYRDYRMLADWDLTLRLLGVGGVAYVDEPLSVYRTWQTPERAARKKLQLEELARVQNEVVPGLFDSGGPENRLYARFVRTARTLEIVLDLRREGLSDTEFGELVSLVRRLDPGPLVAATLAVRESRAAPVLDLLAEGRRKSLGAARSLLRSARGLLRPRGA